MVRSSTTLKGLALVLALAGWGAPGQAAFAALFGDDVARRQVLEQAKRVDALTARHDEFAGRLTRIEDALRAQGEAMKAQAAQSAAHAAQAQQATQPMLELASQLQLLHAELKTLRGQIEVLSHNLDGSVKRQRDMYVDLDTRLRRLEQPPAPPPAAAAPPVTLSTAPALGAPPPPPGPPPVASVAPGLPPGVPPTEAQIYEAAQQLRRDGNYAAAIGAFQNFVAQFPRSPLAHRAQYWIGDSYFNLRDFKTSIVNQQKLIATYPDSASVPDALLNIASSQLELGETAAARRTMDSLIARFPGSEAAERAKRRLAALR